MHVPEGERQKESADDDRQRDDRPPPLATDDAVEEDQDRIENVDHRLKDVGEKHDRLYGAVAFGVRQVVFCGNDRWSGGDGNQPQVSPTS